MCIRDSAGYASGSDGERDAVAREEHVAEQAAKAAAAAKQWEEIDEVDEAPAEVPMSTVLRRKQVRLMSPLLPHAGCIPPDVLAACECHRAVQEAAAVAAAEAAAAAEAERLAQEERLRKLEEEERRLQAERSAREAQAAEQRRAEETARRGSAAAAGGLEDGQVEAGAAQGLDAAERRRQLREVELRVCFPPLEQPRLCQVHS